MLAALAQQIGVCDARTPIIILGTQKVFPRSTRGTALTNQAVIARLRNLEATIVFHGGAQTIQGALGGCGLATSQGHISHTQTRAFMIGIHRQHLLVDAHRQLVLTRQHHLVRDFDARLGVVRFHFGQGLDDATRFRRITQLSLATYEVQTPFHFGGVCTHERLQVRQGFQGPLQVQQDRCHETTIAVIAQVKRLQVHTVDLTRGHMIARPSQHARQQGCAVCVFRVTTHDGLQLTGCFAVVATSNQHRGQATARIEITRRQLDELGVARTRLGQATSLHQQASVFGQRLTIARMQLLQLFMQRESFIKAPQLQRVARRAQQNVALQIVPLVPVRTNDSCRLIRDDPVRRVERAGIHARARRAHGRNRLVHIDLRVDVRARMRHRRRHCLARAGRVRLTEELPRNRVLRRPRGILLRLGGFGSAGLCQDERHSHKGFRGKALGACSGGV